MEKVFETLYALNCNDKTEKKNGLTYLSWAWAWQKVMEKYPTATYEIVKNDAGLPFFHDQATGYMCFTKVTIDNVTREMWLPVMDSANNAMKSVPYDFTTYTKYGEKKHHVNAATMFDINKTIMRCLVKNLAMFGLGLYIYAGEDLPDSVEDTDVPAAPVPQPAAPQPAAPSKTAQAVKAIQDAGIEVTPEAPKPVAQPQATQPQNPQQMTQQQHDELLKDLLMKIEECKTQAQLKQLVLPYAKHPIYVEVRTRANNKFQMLKK